MSRKYTKSHEWVLDNGDGTVTVGITDHAQEQLGDLVYIGLPEVGDAVESGDDLVTIESVKTASNAYAPVSGEVVAVNEELENAPETVNSSPYDDGWFVKIKTSDDLGSLLDESDYQAVVDSE